MKRLISSLLALSLLLSCLPMGTRAAGANVEVLYPSNGENTGSLDSIYDDMIANSPTLPNLEPTISGSMGTLEPSVPGELIPAIPLPTVPGGGLAPETDDTTPATLPIPPEIDDVPATGGGSQTEPTLPAAPTEPPMPDEDFEIDDVPKTDGELEQDEVGNWYFRTFAQLKELCSMTFDTPATAYYEGPEDFILSANLAIPANLTVDFSWMNQTPGTVTIPAGVSLISETHTLNDEECMCGADELMDLSAMLTVTGLAFHALNVEGNLSVKEMMVYDSLNVTGKVYNHGTIEFADGASITGEENIIHTSEKSLLYIEKRADDTASLKAAIELVKSQTTPHKRFNLRLLGDVTIDADVTVPAGCDFEIGVAFLKIAPGVTLTLDAYTTIICNTTVEGTLVNNGGILLHECYWNAPRVTIAQGGAYRGNGKIIIHDNNTNESSEMFTNLDLNQFTITASDPAIHYWVLEKKASSDELYQDADGNWHFYTFDHLKQLSAMNIDDYTQAFYEGDEALVISENLTTPDQLHIELNNKDVVIPAGVSFGSGNRFWGVGHMKVEGSADFTLSQSTLSVYGSLKVTGKLISNGPIGLHDGATVEGEENIAFTDSWNNYFCHWYEATNAAELAKATELAHTQVVLENDIHVIQTYGNFSLQESCTIPESASLYVESGTLEIPTGKALTIDGQLSIWGQVQVNGTILNNRNITLYPHGEWNGTDYAITTPSLVFGSTGIYSGNGFVMYPMECGTDISKVISGLDTSIFAATESHGEGGSWYTLRPCNNGPTLNSSGQWEFFDFEDLQELASRSYPEYTTAVYYGSEPLVISSTLTLPDNLYVKIVATQSAVVPSGVTLTAKDMFCNDLTVDGTLNLKGQLSMDFGSELTGYDNITFVNDTSTVCILASSWYPGYVFKEIKPVLEAAAADQRDHITYHITADNDFSFEESVAIPQNTYLTTYKYYTCTIPAGVTVTLYGQLHIASPYTVNGSLVNNGNITIANLCSSDTTGKLTIDGAQYLGNGTITVITDSNDVKSIVSGINWDDFDVTKTVYPVNGAEFVIKPKSSYLHQDADGNWHFKTFEELKQIVGSTSSCGAIYDGTDPLVIEEDLLTKESLAFLNAGQSEVVVPAGVTFTMSSQGTTFHANKLRVQGTAYLDKVHIYESMDVSGYLEVHCDAFLHDGATVTGRKNISFSIGNLYHEMEIASADELKTAVDKALFSSDRFNLWLVNHVTLSESIVIPENCTLSLGDVTLTIPKKVTFQLDGKMDVSGYVVVEGSLVNNNEIYLNCPNSKTPALVLEKHGTYSGNGNIVINVMQYADRDYTRALSGLDLSGFTVTDNGETILLGCPKLPAPTDLEWGYDHYRNKSIPGYISWKPVEPTHHEARIEIFRQGENEPAFCHNWILAAGEEWHSIGSFILDDPDSGTYYFTVVSIDDNGNFLNSDPSTSPAWTYERPNKKLDICTDLSWNWPYVNYTGPEGAGGYHVEFWFKESESAPPRNLGSTWSLQVDEGEIFTPGISDSDIYQCGSGYYYYTVRAISTDITTICNSEWVTSPLYNLTDTVIKVDKDLQEISDNMDQMTDGEIRQAVQDMDTQELKDAMLADSGVAETIDELERKAGNFDKVKVKDVSIPAGQVNVIGAGLNTPANSDEGISLVISKPEKEHEVPKGYDSAVALKFSMDLSNVDNTEKLEVPVLITMPIPKGIDPSKLAIIHYHNDGTSEIISKLNVDKRNHTVTFVLTSFSDFTITQTAPEEEILWGDASGDGKVNAMDATRILRYAAKLIAEDKIDLIAADVNSDGRVNAMDATRILRYAAKLITDLKK